jgi:cell division FtsZ-interacting protein ZapD
MRSITSILLFLLGIALIFWAAKPLWQEILSLRQERSVVFGTLSELKNLEKVRDNLLSSYNSIAKMDLEKLNQMLPQGSNTGGILVSLERIAQDTRGYVAAGRECAI